VPELNDPPLHEISSYSWRIIYHLREDNVFIVTCSQAPPARSGRSRAGGLMAPDTAG
jgi:hypothetical protein